MHILVVEDGPETTRLIEHIVGPEGHHCIVARSTAEADLVLETVAVDAILADRTIQGDDVLSWVEQVALLVAETGTRVVVLADAPPVDGDETRIRKAGAHALVKPFSFAQLRACIDTDDRPDRTPPAVSDEAPADDV